MNVRKLAVLPVVALLMGMCYTSCTRSSSSSSSTTTTPTTTTNSMTATIGSSAFAATGTMVTGTMASGHMSITGSNVSPNNAIILMVDHAAAIGTYTIDGGTYAIWGNGSATVSAAYGTISITSISPEWVGTFSFTLTDSTRITSGAFHVTPI